MDLAPVQFDLTQAGAILADMVAAYLDAARRPLRRRSAMTMTTSKITQHHLMRKACVYIRQSTPGQVRFNQESTERNTI